jgi:hypothetical protein
MAENNPGGFHRGVNFVRDVAITGLALMLAFVVADAAGWIPTVSWDARAEQTAFTGDTNSPADESSRHTPTRDDPQGEEGRFLGSDTEVVEPGAPCSSERERVSQNVARRCTGQRVVQSRVNPVTGERERRDCAVNTETGRRYDCRPI